MLLAIIPHHYHYCKIYYTYLNRNKRVALTAVCKSSAQEGSLTFIT